MGLNSVQTYDLEMVQKYVTALTSLAICSMIVRFVWVADFILVVKQLLHKMHEDEQKNPTNSNNDGNTNIPKHVPDSKIVLTYGIQVRTHILSKSCKNAINFFI